MPIHYACDSEERAKELSLAANGEYFGATAAGPTRFRWRTHTGLCVSSFSRASTSGDFERVMVVYNEAAETFGEIVFGSVSGVPSSFAVGGAEDAPATIRARYSQFRDQMAEAKRQAKGLAGRKVWAASDSRLRRLKGKPVEVIGGTAIRHGTAGDVFWTGYGEKGAPRIGFKGTDGVCHWINLDNVRELKEYPLFAKAS
jgi:hypothetical protein